MTTPTPAQIEALIERLAGEARFIRICGEAASALVSLRDENAALRKDAERYRWLRGKGALKRQAHIAVLTRNGGYVAEEEVADAAIDAALAQPRGGE